MLAIALQVWNGDVWTAKRLTSLICRIEPRKRSDIEFIISARRETNKNAVQDIAKIAERTFPSVQVIHGKRFGVGWPNGCNDLWAETMMRVSQLKKAGRIKSTGVLTFESDCLPLRSDWLEVISEDWEKAYKNGFKCIGHAHGDPATHINGNAVFDCNVIIQHPELNGSDSLSGWDAFHGKLLLKIGRDTNLIFQQYRLLSIFRSSVEAIRKNGIIPALYHGVKGVTGLQAVEDMVEDGTFFTR